MKNWRNKKILIAEDDLVNYNLITNMLVDTEIEPIHAENGKEALELFICKKIDVILMDIKMQVMDGIEATKEIRKLNKNIVIIAQTAFHYKKEQCISAGFTDFIAKPFTDNQLIELLQQYLPPFKS